MFVIFVIMLYFLIYYRILIDFFVIVLYNSGMRYNILNEPTFKQKYLVCEQPSFYSLIPIEYGEQKNLASNAVPIGIRTNYVIHYVTSGFGCYTVNRKTYQVKPGNLFIIPPYKKVSYIADKNDPWRYAWIKFDIRGNIPSFLNQPVINIPEAGSLFEEMHNCLELENPTLYLSSKLYYLFHLLSSNDNKKRDIIDEAINFIQAKLSSNIKINELADHFGYNRAYFSTLFAKRMGASPQKYILNLRMTTAAELMLKHNQSPTIAAQTVGYLDFYLFSKMFKKFFGLSPRQYIKKHKR